LNWIWNSIQLNAIPINWVSIPIQSICNWISTDFSWIKIKLNWTPLWTLNWIELNWIEIPQQWLLIFRIQHKKKIPKYVQRQIEKEAPSPFVQQFLIEVHIYLRIGWLCEIVKWATTNELYTYFKLILIIIVAKIICQYDCND